MRFINFIDIKKELPNLLIDFTFNFQRKLQYGFMYTACHWLDVWDHFLLNLIKIADMLSMPYWFPLSFETSSSSNYSQIALNSFLSKRALTQSTIYAFVLIYHMPSHPIIIKSMFQFLIFLMSGLAVIICSYGDNASFFLYSPSPKALDKLRPPFTLPKFTVPPAFVILFIYYGSYGLWSLLNYSH